jgi:hypothetical protein
MRDLDTVFDGLSRSEFRRKFRLDRKDLAYLEARGLETVLAHAADFVAKRLAPAEPVNDGAQTPWRGHPVFTAQHATATCCRACLAKWYGVPKGREMTEAEQAQAVAAISRWLQGRPTSTRRAADR